MYANKNLIYLILKTDENGVKLENEQKYAVTLVVIKNFNYTSDLTTNCPEILSNAIFDAADAKNSDHKRVIITCQ